MTKQVNSRWVGLEDRKDAAAVYSYILLSAICKRMPNPAIPLVFRQKTAYAIEEQDTSTRLVSSGGFDVTNQNSIIRTPTDSFAVDQGSLVDTRRCWDTEELICW